MASMFSGKARLEMLGYDIVHTISAGKKEDVDGLIKYMEEGKVVSYLMEKYKDDFFLVHDQCPYNIDDWEKLFQEYSYIDRHHDVIRKMGILHEDEGLLMMISVILDLVSTK